MYEGAAIGAEAAGAGEDAASTGGRQGAAAVGGSLDAGAAAEAPAVSDTAGADDSSLSLPHAASTMAASRGAIRSRLFMIGSLGSQGMRAKGNPAWFAQLCNGPLPNGGVRHAWTNARMHLRLRAGTLACRSRRFQIRCEQRHSIGVAIILGETGRLINWLIAGGGCHQSTPRSQSPTHCQGLLWNRQKSSRASKLGRKCSATPRDGIQNSFCSTEPST